MVYANKDTVRVMIITKENLRFEGDMYILSGSRLTDALNSKAKDFFALTDAKIWSGAGDTLLGSPQYVAINRDSIAAIYPIA